MSSLITDAYENPSVKLGKRDNVERLFFLKKVTRAVWALDNPTCFSVLGDLHAFTSYRSFIQNGGHFGFYFLLKLR